MSVYLGQDKVAITNILNKSTDAEIKMYDYAYVPWERPNGLPDLDSLNLQMSGDNDFIYFTFKVGQPDSIFSFHIDGVAASDVTTCNVGTITNGTFNTEYTESCSNNTDHYIYLDDNAGYSSGYKVIRLVGKFKRCYLIACSKTEGGSVMFRQQPIIERIAWVPHLIAFSTSTANGWGTYHLQREKIANGQGTALTSMLRAYYDSYSLEDLDISGLHTPNVTSFDSAFYNCLQLRALDLSHFDTTKVTSFNAFCYNNRCLKNINISGFSTANVTTFSSMFYGCYSLREIIGFSDLLPTSKVTTLSGMFYDCRSLRALDGLERWNTTNVTSIANLFNGCMDIQNLNLSTWDLAKCKNVSSLFNNCISLKTIAYPAVKTSPDVTSANAIFAACRSLQDIDCSWIDLSGGKCTNVASMFSGAQSVQEINIPSNWDMSGVTGSNYAYYIFANCYSVKKITGITNWNFAKYASSMAYMFSGCYSLTTLDISGWTLYRTTSFASFFENCRSLKTIDVGNLGVTSYCTSLASMFASCYSLQSIGNVSGWVTSAVTTFASMFYGCQSLKTLPNIGSWNYSAATTLASMLSYCASLQEISLPNLTLSACTTVATCFRYCYSLEKITLTGWSFPKVTSTAPAQFLADCPSLKEIVGPPAFALNHSYANDLALEYNTILAVINALPTVATARTLNLTTQNINRLTTAEKAIATNKNWTLAN